MYCFKWPSNRHEGTAWSGLVYTTKETQFLIKMISKQFLVSGDYKIFAIADLTFFNFWEMLAFVIKKTSILI